MTWQHDPRVKAVFDEIVAHTPDIGDTPAEHTTDLTPKGRRRSRAGVAVATVAAAVIGLAGLITARAGGGDHRSTAIATPPANGSDIVATTTSGVDTPEPSGATPAAPTTVTSSTAAAPTAALKPATSTAPPAGFAPLRPGHVAATWLPSGYTQSDDPPYLRLSAPTQPADDIWVKVERDTSAHVGRPETAVDVPVRGGTAWVDVVSTKDTTMLLFRDADSVYLIIYAPADIPTDSLVRIADGLTN